ncbi:MAG: carboxypeptidase regulatory-like domain-containing protein [Hyalangium sp.]
MAAVIVALGVAGLWFLLDEGPREQGSKQGAPARSVSTASHSTRAAPPRQAPSSQARQQKPPEGVLAVEVLSKNQPLPGARVQVYEREPADLSVFPARWFGREAGPTGADGRWELPIAPGSYYVAARAEGLAPAYASVVHPPGSARTAVRLLLEEGMELVGSTLDKATGEPVSLAEVILTPPAFTSGARDRVDAPEEEGLVATSNELGEFRFPGLVPGRYRLEAHAPGYASTVLPSAPIPFRGLATLVMVPGGSLDGMVLGTNGEPAAEAEVLAVSRDQAVSALSDSEGHFSIEVPPGAYALSAQRGPEAGALEGEVSVTAGQRVQGLRLQLGAAAWLSGKVVRGDDSGVGGARVEVSPRALWAASHQAGTDESGAFSLPALAPGTYTLQVSLPDGGHFTHGPVTLAAGEHTSLTLTDTDDSSRAGSLFCAVHERGSRREVMNALLRVTSLQPQSPAAPRTVERKGCCILFERLEPGPYRVEARRDPHAQAIEKLVTVRRERREPCELELDDATDPQPGLATLEGRVLEPSGSPPSEPVAVEAFFQGRLWPIRKRILTDDQGRFRLLLSPGPYTLSAFWPRSLGCPASRPHQVQLKAGPNPETPLLVEEHPPDLRLQVVDADGAPARQALARMLDDSPRSAEYAQTDEQGRLDVCLPAEVARPQGSTAALVINSSDSARAARVDVTQGPRERTVRLRPLPAFQGRVIQPYGAPVRHVILEIIPPNQLDSPRIYEFMGDHFELPRFPLGPTQILVNADGQRASLFVELQPEEHKVLEIPVYPVVSLTGRLVDAATRQPVALVINPRSFLGQRTGPDGRFSFRALPAGELMLYIAGQPPLRVKLSPGQINDLGDLPVHIP